MFIPHVEAPASKTDPCQRVQVISAWLFACHATLFVARSTWSSLKKVTKSLNDMHNSFYTNFLSKYTALINIQQSFAVRSIRQWSSSAVLDQPQIFKLQWLIDFELQGMFIVWVKQWSDKTDPLTSPSWHQDEPFEFFKVNISWIGRSVHRKCQYGTKKILDVVTKNVTWRCQCLL